jgi:hypothetical protein
MLDHQKRIEIVSLNSTGASADLSSARVEYQHEFQTDSILFEDGHVKIVNKFCYVASTNLLCDPQVAAYSLNFGYDSVPQSFVVLYGGVDA